MYMFDAVDYLNAICTNAYETELTYFHFKGLDLFCFFFKLFNCLYAFVCLFSLKKEFQSFFLF